MNISVVMATYNGAKYIREQLDSIRNQSVPADEVIICDDCSTDNTVEVIGNYIKSHRLDEKWKVYRNESNLGYANNFNKAAGLASGRFLMFSDQDDIWLKDKIKISLKIMEEYSDCQVLCTDYEPFMDGENAPRPPKDILKRMPNDKTLEKVLLDKKSVYIRALGCCMCVRKTFFRDIERYWFEGWAQDDRMWRLSQCVDGCYLLHSNLVRHRIHNNNTSTYGKYHTVEKRVQLFSNMQKANRQMLRMLTVEKKKREISIMKKHLKMMTLRIEMLTNKKLINIICLIPYMGYYERKKSFLVEMYLLFCGGRE